MKLLAAMVSLVSCSSLVAGQCVEVKSVETVRIEPSAKNVKVTVLLDGRPQENVKLTISRPAGQGSRFLVTDSHGTAMLKNLPLGISCVHATAKNNASAEICLEVLAHFPTDTASFQMTLAVAAPRLNSFDERVNRSEQSPPAARMRSFKGAIVDPLGALVPNAEIRIYERGSYPQHSVKTLKTNELGRFSDVLAPGIYTVLVQMPGFRTEFVSVEISGNGKDEELRLPLQLAATDTCE